jgi:hypothetical protein
MLFLSHHMHYVLILLCIIFIKLVCVCAWLWDECMYFVCSGFEKHIRACVVMFN